MKKPKLPENLYFWLDVVKDPKKIQDFMKRGNPRAKRNLLRALKYDKWLRIQKKEEANERKEIDEC